MALQDYNSSSTADRRSYYRIDDEVFFEYRQIQERQVNSVISGARHRDTRRSKLLEEIDTLSRQSRAQLKGIKKSHPIIARYLSTLDDKIDTLARHVSAQDDAGDRPNRWVNLSAGGVAFYTDEPVAPESLIAVTLKLFPSHREIATYGPVVYCRHDPQASPEAPYRVAVNFAFMRSHDRESLVNHVLGKQMASARTERSGLPN